jgi:hypothetical protein
VIEQHGWAEFGRWHLAEDDEIPFHTSAATSFPMATSKRCTAVR